MYKDSEENIPNFDDIFRDDEEVSCVHSKLLVSYGDRTNEACWLPLNQSVVISIAAFLGGRASGERSGSSGGGRGEETRSPSLGGTPAHLDVQLHTVFILWETGKLILLFIFYPSGELFLFLNIK